MISICYSKIDGVYFPSKIADISFKPYKSSIQIVSYQDSNDEDNRWSFEIYGEI